MAEVPASGNSNIHPRAIAQVLAYFQEAFDLFQPEASGGTSFQVENEFYECLVDLRVLGRRPSFFSAPVCLAEVAERRTGEAAARDINAMFG